MICTRPNYALDLGKKENGKRFIKFLPKRVDLYSAKTLQARYGADAVLPLPCGTCLACRINHAKEWAVRCVLESLYHEENYFITLTYDDDHVPSDGFIHREHMREFQKRVWRKFPGVRFFGCGEYGSKNLRPHFHLIAFGLNLTDFKSVGNGLMESKTIKELWPYGFNYIGEVNYMTCNYVAQYCNKKAFGDLKYNVPPMNREYVFMSTKPGIGYQWCQDHLSSVLEYDAVFGPFGSSKSAALPRYFQKIAEDLDGDKFKELKKIRLDKGNALTINECLVHSVENVEEVYALKDEALLGDYITKRKGVRL